MNGCDWVLLVHGRLQLIDFFVKLNIHALRNYELY